MLRTKKVLGAAFVLMLLAWNQVAAAYGNTYIDQSFDFKKLEHVVILPLRKVAPGDAEISLIKESKRVKKIFSLIDGNLLPNNLASKEMADTIKERTGAGAFLVTEIVEMDSQVDDVEAIEVPVSIHKYTEVSGPKGTHREKERSFEVYHTIPAHSVEMKKLEADFKLYDSNTGKLIFSYNDIRRSYDHDYGSLFQNLAKEFFIALRDIPKQAEKTKGRNLKLEELTLNGEIGENDSEERLGIITAALESVMKLEGEKIKKLSFPKYPQGDFVLRTKVLNYKDNATWNMPYASTRDKLVSSWSEKIRVPVRKDEIKTTADNSARENDKKPSKEKQEYKEEVIEHKTYVSEIENHYGRYSFKAEVSLYAEAVDKKTGIVAFVYNDTKSNDKRADAWKSLVKDFYGKLAKAMKNR